MKQSNWPWQHYRPDSSFLLAPSCGDHPVGRAKHKPCQPHITTTCVNHDTCQPHMLATHNSHTCQQSYMPTTHESHTSWATHARHTCQPHMSATHVNHTCQPHTCQPHVPSYTQASHLQYHAITLSHPLIPIGCAKLFKVIQLRWQAHIQFVVRLLAG